MNALRLSNFLLSPVLLLTGCDFGEQGPPDPDPPVQTEIVRIEVIPNPVVAGDTALFRAIIEDSLDARFEYQWTKALGNFEGVEPRFRVVITDTNSVRWVAPSELGTFGSGVRIDNGSRDSTAVGKSFDVTVVSGN
ncbi:MAG: hypothetical protein ACR2GR_12260 [Rhodothermales bacterium]